MRAICGLRRARRLVPAGQLITHGGPPRWPAAAARHHGCRALAAGGSSGPPSQAAFPATREPSYLQDPGGPGAFRRPRTSRSHRTSDIPVSRATSSLHCPAGRRPPPAPVVPKPCRNHVAYGARPSSCVELCAEPLPSPHRPQARARAVATAGPVPRKELTWLVSPPTEPATDRILRPHQQPGGPGCRSSRMFNRLLWANTSLPW